VGTTDKVWIFHAKYHHIFVAGACGADLQVRKLLHTKFDVWEGVPPFSLHDLVGYWIPTNHGVVNVIYSKTSTRVEPYYTHVSDPHVLPFTPVFVGISLVSMRKANKNKDKPKGGRNALAAAAAPETETKIAGGSGEGEVAGGSGSGEGDRGGDGGGIGAVDLNENENSETGYSCRRLRHTAGWASDITRWTWCSRKRLIPASASAQRTVRTWS